MRFIAISLVIIVTVTSKFLAVCPACWNVSRLARGHDVAKLPAAHVPAKWTGAQAQCSPARRQVDAHMRRLPRQAA